MNPVERVENLVEWIKRDRKESDKVISYVLELQNGLLDEVLEAALRGGILSGTEWEDEDPYK